MIRKKVTVLYIHKCLATNGFPIMGNGIFIHPINEDGIYRVKIPWMKKRFVGFAC